MTLEEMRKNAHFSIPQIPYLYKNNSVNGKSNRRPDLEEYDTMGFRKNYIERKIQRAVRLGYYGNTTH